MKELFLFSCLYNVIFLSLYSRYVVSFLLSFFNLYNVFRLPFSFLFCFGEYFLSFILLFILLLFLYCISYHALLFFLSW